MSSNPQVNVEHALPIASIQKVKKDLQDFTAAPELTEEQSELISSHINLIDAALLQFMKDNHDLDRQPASTTDVNLSLYHGLKRMYNDLLNELRTVKEQKIATEQADRNKPLEYIEDELPYLQAAQRKAYIDTLIMNDTHDEELKKQGERFLTAVVKLYTLDSSIEENLRVYMTLVRKLGFSTEQLHSKLPNEIRPTNHNIPEDDNIEKGTNEDNSKEDSKKKISFSKYLKKEDSSKRPLNDDSNEGPEMKKIKSTSIEDDNIETNGLKSILKNRDQKNSTKKKPVGIKFQSESSLITVFGDGLPNTGLQVSPEELKKILQPFVAGQPREFPLRDPMPSVLKLPMWDIRFDENVNNSDISELKGGPVPCATRTPLTSKVNFINFSTDLNKPAREPVNLDEGESSQPVIAKAFGQNKLLLRKDRGGLPYKRIPDIVRNKYAPRAG
ncbi:RNA-processing protein REF2 [Nakaseomyces bracarensis]|uniref:RNA-processing protein REF2 n=1 Tax=Nakaseomyces bracarensis TaxID=273131 RepID=UPI003871D7CC